MLKYLFKVEIKHYLKGKKIIYYHNTNRYSKFGLVFFFLIPFLFKDPIFYFILVFALVAGLRIFEAIYMHFKMNVFKKSFLTSFYNNENILVEFNKKKLNISSTSINITININNFEIIYKDENMYIICIYNEINLIIPVYDRNTDFFINLEKNVSISNDIIHDKD